MAGMPHQRQAAVMLESLLPVWKVLCVHCKAARVVMAAAAVDTISSPAAKIPRGIAPLSSQKLCPPSVSPPLKGVLEMAEYCMA